MRVESLLIAGNNVIANFRQCDRLEVARKSPKEESHKYRTADHKCEISASVDEGFVDNGIHNPGGERR